MRPLKWARNAFVLTALIFDKKILDLPSVILRVSGAFALFCLVASGVYLVNDLLDIERDRQHPKKCKRPLASGRLPIPLADRGGGGAAWARASVLGFYQEVMLGVILLPYAVINLAYSQSAQAHGASSTPLPSPRAMCCGWRRARRRCTWSAFRPGSTCSPSSSPCSSRWPSGGKRLLLLTDNAGAHRASLNDYSNAPSSTTASA